MKRFHVHISVENLPHNINFYSKLFGAEPTVTKDDYAKWMRDEPRINFAISSRDGKPGLNHLGFQVDSDEELSTLREQTAAADIAAVEDMGAACCYAKSDKYWVEDPQGIAWETFHSLGSIPVFGLPSSEQGATSASACCAPAEKPAAQSQGSCKPGAASGCC